MSNVQFSYGTLNTFTVNIVERHILFTSVYSIYRYAYVNIYVCILDI